MVSRMITGGSAGFSTMMALPRAAPPSFATAHVHRDIRLAKAWLLSEIGGAGAR